MHCAIIINTSRVQKNIYKMHIFVFHYMQCLDLQKSTWGINFVTIPMTPNYCSIQAVVTSYRIQDLMGSTS